jgi:hypothetical protein
MRQTVIQVYQNLIVTPFTHLNRSFGDPTFLAFPADMDACLPELERFHAALRRALFELYKHHARAVIEAANEMDTKKWRGMTAAQHIYSMALYASTAGKVSKVKPLEDAMACKNTLEM